MGKERSEEDKRERGKIETKEPSEQLPKRNDPPVWLLLLPLYSITLQRERHDDIVVKKERARE